MHPYTNNAVDTSWLSITFSGLSRTALCGSEAQKQKYLPSLAELSTVACWVRCSVTGVAFTICIYIFLCLCQGTQIFLSVWYRLWLSPTMEVMQVPWKQQQQRSRLSTFPSASLFLLMAVYCSFIFVTISFCVHSKLWLRSCISCYITSSCVIWIIRWKEVGYLTDKSAG